MNILKFEAPWCGPCITMQKRIDKYIKDNPVAMSDVSIEHVVCDAELPSDDANDKRCDEYNVKSFPTLVACVTIGGTQAVIGHAVGTVAFESFIKQARLVEAALVEQGPEFRAAYSLRVASGESVAAAMKATADEWSKGPTKKGKKK